MSLIKESFDGVLAVALGDVKNDNGSGDGGGLRGGVVGVYGSDGFDFWGVADAASSAVFRFKYLAGTKPNSSPVPVGA